MNNNTKTLPELEGHIVSYSEHGNLNGPAILSFHGGPGSKSKPYHAERFDLEKYRVVLFDQRGCGESAPLGELKNNETDKLLEDAERIREALGIESWFVSGGSWGSTCALLYAIKYSDRVRGLLLSALFLGDRDSINWSFGEGGASVIMSDVWNRRMEFFAKYDITVENQNEKILELLKDGDEETKKDITAGVFNWEGNLFSPMDSVHYQEAEDIDEKDVASAKIFVHYESNHEFIPDNYILDNTDKLSEIPCMVVHGRYDILCPLSKAVLLQEKMANCKLVIADSSGHKLSAEGKVIQELAFEQLLKEHS